MEIVRTLQASVAAALADPAVHAKLVEGDFGPVGSTPEEFAKFIKEEITAYGRIIEAAGIKRQDY
jgi:tripartite-type tricarboxylate transporter receptor subunit TctC